MLPAAEQACGASDYESKRVYIARLATSEG